MKSLTVYVMDDYEGETPEEKTYQCISEAYEESGDELTPEEASKLFRVIEKEVNFGSCKVPLEWKVVIEGEDSDINYYEDILNQIG